MAALTKAQFAKYLSRDRHCWHCGSTDDTLVPHHRANRGMGGSKLRHRPANIIVMCAAINSAMESDASVALAADKYGWKIASWEDPTKRPIFDRTKQLWFYLDDDFGRIRTRKDK